MKKFTSILFTLIMVLSIFMFTLTGCTRNTDNQVIYNTGTSYYSNNGQDIFNADITGKWTLVAFLDKDLNSQTLEEYCKAEDKKLSSVECTYEFKKDNSVVGKQGNTNVKGTYTFDGKTLIAEFKSSEVTFDYNEVEDTLSSEDKKTGMTSVMTR